MSQSLDQDSNSVIVPATATSKRKKLSNKAQLQQRLAIFITETETTAGWTADGFRPDLPLLGRILARPDPQDIRGGSVATGLDLWSAAMLRQAGLTGVRPHARSPFFVSQAAIEAQDRFQSIDDALERLKSLAQNLRSLPTKQQQPHIKTLTDASKLLRNALTNLRSDTERGTTSVLGEGRRKQVDVFMAEWDRGLELLISTKTVALAVTKQSDIVKNLVNRWEEFDGDLKNLRGRFPLAVIGALLIVPATTVGRNLQAYVDMMLKLTAPGRPWENAYDRTAIMVADWDSATPEAVPILNDELTEEQLPAVLQPAMFFDDLLRRLFERSPISEHRNARALAAAARGEDASLILRSAELVSDASAADTDDDSR